MTRFLLICLGGAAGTGARYLTAVWAASTFETKLPLATLLVNLVGSFLIALIAQLDFASDTTRLALTTGVLGGFTTYSAFNYETTQLFRAGMWGGASLNLLVTVLGCLAAGLAGAWVGRMLAR